MQAQGSELPDQGQRKGQRIARISENSERPGHWIQGGQQGYPCCVDTPKARHEGTENSLEAGIAADRVHMQQ